MNKFMQNNIKNIAIPRYNIHYYILSLIFIVTLILSNVAASKLLDIYGYKIDAGTIFFPMLYVLNDVLTEVYGFLASRKIIFVALLTNIFFGLALYLVVLLPSAADSSNQEAFQVIFSLSPRIIIGSLLSYMIGELLNASILTYMKKVFKGKHFSIRALFSTLCGSFLESIIFSYIVFGSRLNSNDVIKMAFTLSFIKVIYEILTLPVTVRLVYSLKKQYIPA